MTGRLRIHLNLQTQTQSYAHLRLQIVFKYAFSGLNSSVSRGNEVASGLGRKLKALAREDIASHCEGVPRIKMLCSLYGLIL